LFSDRKRGSDGLLTDHGEFMVGCHLHKHFVMIHVGNDINEVQFLLVEQLLRIVVGCGNLKLLRESLRFGNGPVVESNALCTGEFAPASKLIPRPETGAEHGELQSTHPSTLACSLRSANRSEIHNSSG